MLRLDGSACTVYAEKVGSGVVEVQLAAVDDPRLECPRLLPGVHLRVGDTGDVLLDVCFYVAARLREVAEQTVMEVGRPRVGAVTRQHYVLLLYLLNMFCLHF